MRLKLDLFRCTGCRTCELTCSLYQFKENNPKKSALRVYGRFPAPGDYKVAFCTQCGKCAEACPVDAIIERTDKKRGVYYTLDREKCINCKACIKVCPEKVLFTHKDVKHPIKCDWCGECMEFCPRKVIRIIDEKARARVK